MKYPHYIHKELLKLNLTEHDIKRVRRFDLLIINNVLLSTLELEKALKIAFLNSMDDSKKSYNDYFSPKGGIVIQKKISKCINTFPSKKKLSEFSELIEYCSFGVLVLIYKHIEPKYKKMVSKEMHIPFNVFYDIIRYVKNVRNSVAHDLTNLHVIKAHSQSGGKWILSRKKWFNSINYKPHQIKTNGIYAVMSTLRLFEVNDVLSDKYSVTIKKGINQMSASTSWSKERVKNFIKNRI